MHEQNHLKDLPRKCVPERHFFQSDSSHNFFKLFAAVCCIVWLTGCLQRTSLEECERSIVRVYCESSPGNFLIGTGFIINNEGMHVVASGFVVAAAKGDKERLKVEAYNGEMLPAEQIMWESKTSKVDSARHGEIETPSIDLALLRVSPQKLPGLRLAERHTVKKGDKVVALGFPAEVREVSMDKYEPFIVRQSVGHISGDLPGPSGYMYQTTAPLHVGQNGGPLLNEWGQVIGINVTGLSSDTSISYAVQSDELIRIAERLRIPVSIVSRRLLDLTNPVMIALVLIAMILAATALFIVLSRQRRATVARGAGRFSQAFRRKGRHHGPGGAVLVVEAGENKGERIPIGSGLRIGRDPAMCNLVLSEGLVKVSKLHAEITGTSRQGEYCLRDMGSRNGTFRIDGRKVPEGNGILLRDGDSFYLVDKRCMFRIENDRR